MAARASLNSMAAGLQIVKEINIVVLAVLLMASTSVGQQREVSKCGYRR